MYFAYPLQRKVEAVKCKNCPEPIYQHDYRWRHCNGLYTCMVRPVARAEPEDADGQE